MGCGASTAQVPPRQLVLLGGGECGKTTIFKQIQLLHGSGFSDEVRSDWISALLVAAALDESAANQS